MGRLKNLRPRVATLETRIGRAPSVPGESPATAEQRYSRHRRQTSPIDHLYTGSRWRRLRADQLHASPLCVMCEAEGRVTPATVCDHITPHRGSLEAFWAGPFQSLCANHHNSAKQREERERDGG